MLTKEQIAQRAKGLGASEIPAILGMDENRTAFSVWLDKTQPQEPKEMELHQQRGHFAEDMIAKMYERDRGGLVEPWQETIVHPEYEWLFCTPDCKVQHPPTPADRLLQIKTTAKFLDEEQCPPAYEAQERTELAVLHHRGLLVADIAALNGGGFVKGQPVYYTIERDEEQERKIIEIAKDWWFTYVVGKKEPPPDASAEYTRYANLQPSKGTVLDVDDAHPLCMAIRSYQQAKETLKETEYACDKLGNELRHALREIDCVKGSFGALYYKSVKGNTKTHWEQVARMLAEDIIHGQFPSTGPVESDVRRAFDELVAKYTETAPSYRKLNPRWSK